MIKLAIAYTSVSVALNQKLSVVANPSAPTNPLPNRAMYFLEVHWVFGFSKSPKRVMVQNINRIVKALENAETALTIRAICWASMANSAKNAPIICKRGAPGG